MLPTSFLSSSHSTRSRLTPLAEVEVLARRVDAFEPDSSDGEVTPVAEDASVDDVTVGLGRGGQVGREERRRRSRVNSHESVRWVVNRDQGLATPTGVKVPTLQTLPPLPSDPSQAEIARRPMYLLAILLLLGVGEGMGGREGDERERRRGGVERSLARRQPDERVRGIVSTDDRTAGMSKNNRISASQILSTRREKEREGERTPCNSHSNRNPHTPSTSTSRP